MARKARIKRLVLNGDALGYSQLGKGLEKRSDSVHDVVVHGGPGEITAVEYTKPNSNVTEYYPIGSIGFIDHDPITSGLIDRTGAMPKEEIEEAIDLQSQIIKVMGELHANKDENDFRTDGGFKTQAIEREMKMRLGRAIVDKAFEEYKRRNG